LHDATSSYVPGSRLIQAFWTVRAASNNVAVVVVLAVILPPALVADLVGSSLGQGRVAAARAGIRNVSSWRKYILQGGVGHEPVRPPTDELLIGDRQIVVEAASHMF
jgi:hypothetical protein